MSLKHEKSRFSTFLNLQNGTFSLKMELRYIFEVKCYENVVSPPLKISEMCGFKKENCNFTFYYQKCQIIL